MFSRSKIRASIIAMAIVTVLSSSTVGLGHGQTGALLRSFPLPAVPNNSIYFPIGVVFDGTNLWYSEPAKDTNDIFYTSTSGTLLNNLNKLAYAGALAWDGTNLWVAQFTTKVTNNVELYVISLGPPAKIVRTVDITSVILGNGSCGDISGLQYNQKTNTLWVTPNPCVGVNNRVTSYLVDTSGNLIRKVSFSIPIASLTQVGDNFYVANKNGTLQGIVQTDDEGNILTSFGGPSQGYEESSYDPITFAPNCALWTMHFSVRFGFTGVLDAWEIPCAN